MKVSCIYWPEARERHLFLEALRLTDNKDTAEDKLPTTQLMHNILEARHSPIRVLNFAFKLEGIPSNVATHLVRHVHAVPFVSTLRNDRQDMIDGDNAPRNTPVNMILYCNAEELMVIANKRLCRKASEKTRHVVALICGAALDQMPELEGLLVPMCQYHGNRCHELTSCGMCLKA